jgi:ABC-type phosphate transport system substrate-binding protein
MSGLKRWSISVVLVVSAVALICGMGVREAAAETICPGTLTINGKGSSLQGPAQAIWKAKYIKRCPTGPTPTYESSGSGAGLQAFRFIGTGSINHSFQFIGTDDAPNRRQIEHAEEVSGGARPIVLPVSQTAIVVGVHLPSGCRFKNHKGIKWGELNKVFGGKTISNWNQFSNVEGTCNEAIKRVVRAEGSGTTYQFKNYLSVLETEKGAESPPCKVKVGVKEFEKWGEIREVGTNEEPNKNWPCSVAEGGTKIITAAGGGKVAEAIKAEPGSIGYLSLPDAKNTAHEVEVAWLQNSLVGTSVTYATPANEEEVGGVKNNTARCENARYTVPKEAYEGAAAGIATDWSETFGAQPNIGGTEYPLCTLTFDIGWNDYFASGYGSGTEAEQIGAAVEDYIGGYIVSGLGQADINHNWYNTLPTGSGSFTNVQGAAEIAAAKLGRHVVLCKEAPLKNNSCPAGKGYAGEVTASLAAGQKVEIKNGEGTITCNESGFSGSYQLDGLGVLTAAAYKDNGAKAGKCITNRIGEPEVLLTFLELPSLTSKYNFSPGEKPTHSGGMFWAEKASEVPLRISFAAETCTYEAVAATGIVVNGAGANPSQVGLTDRWEPISAENGNLGLCPTNLKLEETLFNLSRPGGGTVYVTEF